MNSCVVSFSPSTSAESSTLTMSPCGSRRRSSASRFAYMYISSAAVMPSPIVRWNSGSSNPISLLLHSKILWRSAWGTPRNSAITWSGSSAATSVTKSHSPLWATLSRIARTISRMCVSSASMRRGVKAELTSLR